MQKTDSIIVPLGSIVRERLDSLLMGARPTRRCEILRAVAKQLDKAIIRCGRRASKDGSHSALIEYLRDPGHRYSQQWQIYFGVLVGVDQPVDIHHADPEVIETKGEPVGSPEEPSVGPAPSCGPSVAMVPIGFHGDTLEAVRSGSSVMVSVRRVCEALGLAPNGQIEKLKECRWATSKMILSVANDGKIREVFCVDLESLPMWLAGITLSKVSPEIHPKLLAYQTECKKVLAAHFGIRSGEGEAINAAALESIREMATTIRAHVELDLVREQRATLEAKNKAAELEAGRAWKEQQDRARRKHQGTQEELPYLNDAKSLRIQVGRLIGLMRSNCDTKLAQDSVGTLAHSLIREGLAKHGCRVPIDLDGEKFMEFIARNQWTQFALGIMDHEYSKALSIHEERKAKSHQKEG